MVSERRKKNALTLASEIATIIGMLGIASLLVEMGVYKNMVDCLCVDLRNERVENAASHVGIQKEINTIASAWAAKTGRPLQLGQ